jgi:hypothetical protein
MPLKTKNAPKDLPLIPTELIDQIVKGLFHGGLIHALRQYASDIGARESSPRQKMRHLRGLSTSPQASSLRLRPAFRRNAG